MVTENVTIKIDSRLASDSGTSIIRYAAPASTALLSLHTHMIRDAHDSRRLLAELAQLARLGSRHRSDRGPPPRTRPGATTRGDSEDGASPKLSLLTDPPIWHSSPRPRRSGADAARRSSGRPRASPHRPRRTREIQNAARSKAERRFAIRYNKRYNSVCRRKVLFFVVSCAGTIR